MAIKLGQQQLEMLQPRAFDLYITELIEHCKQTFPKLTQRLPEPELRTALIEALKKTTQNGITDNQPTLYYIDLMILLGADFQTDPQYAWINDWFIETANYSQLAQTGYLHGDCLDYLGEMYGDNDIHKYATANQLKEFDLSHYTLSAENFDEEILFILKDIFPKKAELVGDKALTNLITQAKQTAANDYQYTRVDQTAYFIITCYLYGHQFNADPFIPEVKALANTFNQQHDYLDNRAALNQLLISAIEQWYEIVI